MKRLVVVAPTYNESANIVLFIENVFDQLRKISNVESFLLISDSHSSDGTVGLIEKIAKKNKKLVYLDVKKRGLGLGLFKGLDYAVSRLKADYLVTIEADLSNDPKKLPQIVELLEKHDLVIGSRYVSGGGVYNWSWWRKKLSVSANNLLKGLAWSSLNEYTNLYRGFRSDVWKLIKNDLKKYEGWLFVPAFVFEILSKKVDFIEIPYIYYDRFGGKSKMHTLSYTKNLLLYALRYRIRKTKQRLFSR